MDKVNVINSFVLNDDRSFTENKATDVNDKANQLKSKFGDLAIDVVNEILGAIEHEDNVMYYEIVFWNDVKNSLTDK